MNSKTFPESESSYRIRKAIKLLKKMTTAQKLDLMVEAGLLTIQQAESAKNRIREQSMPIKIIVGYDENRVIGNKGKLPWRIPEDMAHFKKITDGCPIIMGRKTWESLPKKFRPLPNRTNIVVTLNMGYKSDPMYHMMARGVCAGVNIVKDLFPGQTAWIIGGGQVYAEALKHDVVDEIIASEIFGRHEGDVFFPEINPADWDRTVLNEFDKFRIVSYRRIRS